MGSFEGLLLSVVCGIMGLIIARKKGHLSGGWAVGCLLLGPLGLILALGVPRDKIALEGQALQSGNGRRCPQCAEVINAKAVKCRYCGSPLDPIPKQREYSCFLCGVELNEYFAKDQSLPCPSCGRKDPLARPDGVQ